MLNYVSIGQVKRDISDLVNRVAYRGERIVLTSRGKPKAVLVSLDDYQRLVQESAGDRMTHWQAWLAEANVLTEQILARRKGEPISVDEILGQDRTDLEARGDWIVSSH